MNRPRLRQGMVETRSAHSIGTMMGASLLSRIGDLIVVFSKKPSRWPLSARARAPFARPPLPILRLVLLCLLAIAGAAWALVRHLTYEPPPMRVPIPGSAPAFDADAGELPAPSLLEPDPTTR
jgi:hypothetical protein